MIVLAAVFLGLVIWGIVANWDGAQISALGTATGVVGAAAARRPQEKC